MKSRKPNYLTAAFFTGDTASIAQRLLGKVLRHCYKGKWLAAQIIETEAYYFDDKGSHASLGNTPSRAALFMPAGTIYMYYSRGKDSLNISCEGDGQAVLIKSAYPYFDEHTHRQAKKYMQENFDTPRPVEKLCAGQTLLCQALGLKLPEWNKKTFDLDKFFIEDVGYTPDRIIQTKRLGIPVGRDEHLPYRFVDHAFAKYCTNNPIKRSMIEGVDYCLLEKQYEITSK